MLPPADKHSRSRFIGRFVLGIAVVIVVIVLAVLAGSKLLHKSSPAKQLKVVYHTSSSAPVNNSTSTGTRSYTAQNYGLTFSYPASWSIFDNGTGPMTATSSPMQLTDAANKKIIGEITMTVEPQGQLPSGFTSGTDLAVLNSQLVSYAQPSSSQSAQTYISFVQYSNATVKGSLNGIYVTGNYGYQKDQVIPASDLQNIDPLITITFTQCGNTTCTANLTPLILSSNDWNETSFQKPILDMIRSFVFS